MIQSHPLAQLDGSMYDVLVNLLDELVILGIHVGDCDTKDYMLLAVSISFEVERRTVDVRKSGPSSFLMPSELPPFFEKSAISFLVSSCRLKLGRASGIVCLRISTSDKKISHSLEIKEPFTLNVAVSQYCLLLVSEFSLFLIQMY
jgi:hypothetical protein